MLIPLDYPVDKPRPEDEQLTWVHDAVHWPDPMPPLAFEIAGHALAQGLHAAARSYELPVGDVRVRRINMYRYQATVPLVSASEEEEGVRKTRSRDKLRAAITGLGELWTDEWRPEIERHLAYWEDFDLPGAPISTLCAHLDETLARVTRIWEIHFVLHYPMHRAIKQFTSLHQELFGGGELDAYRLLQGFDNRTLQMGRALWELSRRALASRPVVEAIQSYAAADALAVLGRSEEGRVFLGELAAYLKEYGCRREKLSLEHTSWSEDPTPILQTLRTYLAQPHGDPYAERDALAQARERQVSEAREALRNYPWAIVHEFEQRLKAAQAAMVLMEEHNHWIDFRAMHQVRRVFLEFGSRLVACDMLEAECDIFYLTLDELRQADFSHHRPSLRGLVAERRAEMDRFRGTTPPPVVGTQAPASPHRSSRCSSVAATEPVVMRGSPGSSGRACGPARVVRTLEEAGKLQLGDVLVARTASSSWTPLFATAAAVIFETGGILSHCAVVAREYSVPMVLGIHRGTELIHDGQMVEVDGDGGMVRIAPENCGRPAVPA
jgi:pyruvate,water dikinase